MTRHLDFIDYRRKRTGKVKESLPSLIGIVEGKRLVCNDAREHSRMLG